MACQLARPLSTVQHAWPPTIGIPSSASPSVPAGAAMAAARHQPRSRTELNMYYSDGGPHGVSVGIAYFLHLVLFSRIHDPRRWTSDRPHSRPPPNWESASFQQIISVATTGSPPQSVDLDIRPSKYPQCPLVFAGCRLRTTHSLNRLSLVFDYSQASGTKTASLMPPSSCLDIKADLCKVEG